MRLTWNLPLNHLSASSISLAITCAEAFRRRYVLKQKDSLFAERFLGICDHRALEANFRQKIDSHEDISVDDLKMAYVRSWTETIDEEGEPDWRDEDPGKLYERGLASAELYHRVVSPTIQPVAVEEKIDFEVPGLPIPVIGFLDVRTQGRVIDRKTSRTKLSKPKPNWKMQAKIYSYATGLPVEFQIITRQATPQIVTAQDSPDLLVAPSDPRQTETLILQVARMISDNFSRYGPMEPWPALGQAHPFMCDYCAAGPKYKGDCIAWAKTDVTAENTSPAPITSGF